jgi:ribosomal protein S18 acetylase RimI-like enzyme
VSDDYSIRPARPSDLEVLVSLTLEEAREAEGTDKRVEDVRRGVQAGLLDPAIATYWVVESANGDVVAATSVLTEWSDFHGGNYWWIQSLFIVPKHRGRGLVELLLNHLTETARAAGALDLRLYAHKSNHRALRAYSRSGFEQAPYVIMRRSLEPDRPE